MDFEEILNKIKSGCKGNEGSLMDQIKMLPREELVAAGKEAKKRLSARFEKKPEDYTFHEKLACTSALKDCARSMPLPYAWLTDIFLMAMLSYIDDADKDMFCKKIEQLVKYIVDYRLELGGNQPEEGN